MSTSRALLVAASCDFVSTFTNKLLGPASPPPSRAQPAPRNNQQQVSNVPTTCGRCFRTVHGVTAGDRSPHCNACFSYDQRPASR